MSASIGSGAFGKGLHHRHRFLAFELAAAVCCCTGVYASVHYAAVVCLLHAGRPALCLYGEIGAWGLCRGFGLQATGGLLAVSEGPWLPGLRGVCVLLPSAATERIEWLGFRRLVLCLYTAASACGGVCLTDVPLCLRGADSCAGA